MSTSNNELYEYAKYLCESAGEPADYLDTFWSVISESPELTKEFSYYAEHTDFLCEYKVAGLTLADILVWQIDRFKAALDEGKFSLKYNGPHMVLAAFMTMADVAKNPEPYLSRFRSETGCDYPGKTYLRDLY